MYLVGVASYVNYKLNMYLRSQFMIQYEDSQIGPLDDEGEIPSTNIANDKWLLEYAIQDFDKHHNDKYVGFNIESVHVTSPGRQFLHISAYFRICTAILRGNE